MMVPILTLLAISTSADILFEDDFSGSEISSDWVLNERSFEYLSNTTASGTLNYQVSDSVYMNYIASAAYWPGATFVTSNSYNASPQAPVSFEIDRIYYNTSSSSGGRCAFYIYNEELDRWIIFSEFTDGTTPSSSTYYGWGYNRYIGETGDNNQGSGIQIPSLATEAFTDQQQHRIKIEANGETASFYVDDTFGTTVKFPYSQGIRFGFGVFARAENDMVDASFDNALITGANNFIFFSKETMSLPGAIGSENTINFKTLFSQQSSDTTLTLNIENPSIAEFDTGTTKTITLSPNSSEYNIPIYKRGIGKTTISISTESNIPINYQQLIVLGEVIGEILMEDEFDGDTLNTNLWLINNRSYEYTTGGTPTSLTEYNLNESQLSINVTAEGHYWPGSALITRDSFQASSVSPLVFEVERESYSYTGSGGRCAIGIYNEDMSNWIIIDDLGDGGSAETTSYQGWHYNKLTGDELDIPTGNGNPLDISTADFGFNDQGRHTIKIVANGQTAQFYIDDVLCLEKNFSFYEGIRFGIGTYSRYETDITQATFNRAVITGSSETVADPVAILTSPVSMEIYAMENNEYILAAEASGTPPISWQWYKDGEPIPGAQSNTYSIARTSANSGKYYAVASNVLNSEQTDEAIINFFEPSTAYESAVLASNPYAYWRLGETEYPTFYEYVARRDASINEGWGTLGEPGAIINDSDLSVALNGKGYISSDKIDSTASELTMIAWIKPTSAINDYTTLLFDRGKSAVGLNIAGNQLCYHWNDNYHDYRSGLYPAIDQWNFVAMAVSPTQATFYLGDSAGNLTTAHNTANHTAITLTSSFTIGGDMVNIDRRFSGLIDEAAIFFSTLTAEQIEYIYQMGYYGNSTPVSFQTQPQSQSIMINDSITLSCYAVGSAPITYQWYQTSSSDPTTEEQWQKIEGATNNFYSFVSEETGTSFYRVIATNPQGSAQSDNAIITTFYPSSSIDLTGEEYKLAAHLKFDGNFNDDSINQYNLTPYGSISFTEGVLGQGATISSDTENFISNYLSFPYDSIKVGTGPLSIAFWTRLHGSPADLPWLCNRNVNASALNNGIAFAPSNGANGWSFYLKADDGQNFTDAGSNGPSGTLPAEEWHHLVFVLDPESQTMKVFLDGKSPTIVDISNIDFESGASTLDTTYSFNIGQDATGYYLVDGSWDIDDMGIWNTALNDIDARNIYYAGKSGRSFDSIVAEEFAPQILEQSGDIELYQINSTITPLKMDLIGSHPLTVAWSHNGTPIAQEGAEIYIPMTPDAAGTYIANISNEFGEVSSNPIKISFIEPSSTYEQFLVSLAPKAYWRLGETKGNTAFEYVFNQFGLYTENMILAQEGAIVDDPNTAVAFDGSNYISAPLSPFTSEEMTMITWIKRDGNQNDFTEILFDRGSSAIGIDLVGNKVAYHWNDLYYNFDSGLTTENNLWNMVAMVITSDKATLYLGNSQGVISQAENLQPHSSGSFTQSFTIGGSISMADRRFKGVIDEPVIFDYALTDEQIQSIYNLGSGKDIPPSGESSLLWSITEENQLTLTWKSGTLETSQTPQGPWTPVDAQGSYITDPVENSQYFRLAL